MTDSAGDAPGDSVQVNVSLPPGAAADIEARILSCGRDVMVESGSGQFSVRKVARAAGVSMGHLQYYFPTRGDLLRALLGALEKDFARHYRRHIRPIRDPVERFVACARHILDDSPANRTIPLLREFWTMAARDARVARMLDQFYGASRKLASAILREADTGLAPQESAHRAATAVALLSGAFLYLDGWHTGAAQPGFRDHVIATVRRLATPDGVLTPD